MSIVVGKVCKRCGETKSADQFRTGSHSNRVCKVCLAAQAKEKYRSRPVDHPSRKFSGKKKPPDDSVRKTKSAWKKRNREKTRANLRVHRAIAAGTLVRQPCYCGRDDAQAHHDDYSKPLDVMWLCPPHHGLRHKQLNDPKECQ
jgi:hypothetical protein